MPDAAVVFAPAAPLYKRGTLGLNSFSTIPTITEINASSDWYQVFALYKRRAAQIYASPTSAPLASGGIGLWPTAASVNALRTAINTMLVDTGLSAFAFGAALSAGNVIRAQHLIDLRTALNNIVSLVKIVCYSPWWQYDRYDLPYGTVNRTPTNTSVPVGNSRIPGIGQSQDVIYSPPGVWARARAGISFSIPHLYSSSAIANFAWKNSYNYAIGAHAFLSLYRSNTDDHLGASGWESNTNTLIGTVNSLAANPASRFFIPIPMSDINAPVGGFISYILGATNDFSNVSGGGQIYYNEAPQLWIDFGF